MTNDIIARLLDFKPLNDPDLAKLLLDAAEHIQGLQAELKICQAERDHHQKWSRTYELELRQARDQIKNSN